MLKFFVVSCLMFAVCFATNAATVKYYSNNVQEIKQVIQEKINANVKDMERAIYCVRLAYLQDPASVNTVDKIYKIVKENMKETASEAWLKNTVAQACLQAKLPKEICLQLTKNEYKNCSYVQIHYIGSNLPKGNNYTLAEKRIGALFGINYYLRFKQEKQISLFISKYLEHAKSEDVAVIKQELLPVYREILSLIPDNQNLKTPATKIGLVLKGCGVDVK